MTSTRSPEEIQQEIEQTRAQLGDTVEALAAKTDVKAQARKRLEDTKATAHEALGKAREASPDTAVSAASTVSRRMRENPEAVAVVGAFALGFLAGRLTND